MVKSADGADKDFGPLYMYMCMSRYHIHVYIESIIGLEVFVFVLRFYGPVNPMGVISRLVSLPNHTFTGQA